MGLTSIEWADKTWNPIRARLKGSERWGYHCEHTGEGCRHCYAEAMNGRMLPAWGTGLKYNVPNREKVDIFLDETELLKPLHWRKPASIFPCSMTDLFAGFAPDAFIDRMFAVMALTPQHRYIVLTKRGKRMREYFEAKRGHFTCEYQANPAKSVSRLLPLGNVILCVSASTQADVYEQVPNLLMTPAACRGLSLEPQIEDVHLELGRGYLTGQAHDNAPYNGRKLDLVIQGGESGHGARPFDLAWARRVRDDCQATGTKYFLKQFGARPYSVADRITHRGNSSPMPPGFSRYLNDRKGGDETEWPADLQGCRQMPGATNA